MPKRNNPMESSWAISLLVYQPGHAYDFVPGAAARIEVHDTSPTGGVWTFNSTDAAAYWLRGLLLAANEGVLAEDLPMPPAATPGPCHRVECTLSPTVPHGHDADGLVVYADDWARDEHGHPLRLPAAYDAEHWRDRVSETTGKLEEAKVAGDTRKMSEAAHGLAFALNRLVLLGES